MSFMLVGAAPAGAQHTFFAFDSTPGSWVGQGFTNYYISPATNWAFRTWGFNIP